MKENTETKIKLLTFGAIIAENLDKGRKSGAGPAGGGYFEFINGSVVNVPLQGFHIKKSPLILQTIEDDDFNLLEDGNLLAHMKRIPRPKFLEKQTSRNIPMKQLALLHGRDCLATTICQTCVYWSKGLQCKFCGIELSLREGSTVSKKQPGDLVEVLRAALEEKVVTHVTLTSGSLETRNLEVNNYITILKALKKEADIPIHVQLEPLSLTNLERLRSAGADTIGIHIESFDPEVFQTICPGKYKNATMSEYHKSWKDAINVFGENQVSTFVLLGLGERQSITEKGLEETIQMGVIPFLVPVRPIVGIQFEPYYKPSFKQNFKNFKLVAKLLKEHQVNPLKNKAGCVRCGACSALNESYVSF